MDSKYILYFVIGLLLLACVFLLGVINRENDQKIEAIDKVSKYQVKIDSLQVKCKFLQDKEKLLNAYVDSLERKDSILQINKQNEIGIINSLLPADKQRKGAELLNWYRRTHR